MTSCRFFIQKPKLHSSSYVFLYGDEHHHLSRVARIKPKEKVWLFDGLGNDYLAQVEEIKREKTRLIILKKIAGGRQKVKITLGQALIRSKKMGFIIQKATELGITTFIPVITSRSVIRVKEMNGKKIERWQKIALEAVKQSQRNLVPAVLSPTPLARILEEQKEGKKLYLSENRGRYLKDILLAHSGSREAKVPCSVIVLVGPEGGWGEEEEKDILSHDYEAVSLGSRVLRAETAALSCIALISHFWNM